VISTGAILAIAPEKSGTQDCLAAERGEFELSGDFISGQ
jgi:hypothetical protein